MNIDTYTVERLIGKYWKLQKTNPEEVSLLAADILSMAKRDSSLEKFTLELGHMQVNRLHQMLDVGACDDIASKIFVAAQLDQSRSSLTAPSPLRT
jgi:hypothetical protein